MQWVASTLHTTSEHGVSSITTADAHTSAASSRLNRRPSGRFKWTRPFRGKTSARVPSHFNWPLPLLYGLGTQFLMRTVVIAVPCNVFMYKTPRTKILSLPSKPFL